MGKGKSITLLSLLCAVIIALSVLAFVPFQVGTKNYNSFLGAIEWDYDVDGGYQYVLTLENDNTETVDDVNAVMNTLSDRMDALGYQNYKVEAVQGLKEGETDYSLVIKAKAYTNAYGEKDKARLDSDIAVVSAYGSVKFFGGKSSATTEILNEEPAISSVSYAGSYTDDDGATQHQVQLTFTSYGYNALVEAINEVKEDDSSAQYYLRITLGDTDILNGPISTDAIYNKSVLITAQTEAAAKQMVLQIQTGGLEYKYKVSEGETIEPILGGNFKLVSLIVFAVILVVAIVAFIIVFGGYGVVASLSLFSFVLIAISMLIAVPGIVVSAEGVFGLLLGMILAIDGLVIIGKRLKQAEEKKTVKVAVKSSYASAFRPVLNVSVITLIASLILFLFAGGGIKCLAMVLIISSIASFLTSMVLSRAFMELILPLVKKKESFLRLKGGAN